MKAVIIEDERQSITNLKSIINQYCPDVEIVGEAMSGLDGIKLIAETNPQLIFLDIELPDMDAFQMLECIGQSHDTQSGYTFDIIFVSAYEGYGIAAVRASALDYIIKPIDHTHLIRAVNKAIHRSNRQSYQDQILHLLTDIHKSKTDQRIALPTLGQTLFARPDQIVRVEAHKNYVHVWLVSSAKLVISMGLYELEPVLLYHGFIKTHQSHIVNRLYVSALVRKDNVNELKMRDETIVPVSRMRVELVKGMLEGD